MNEFSPCVAALAVWLLSTSFSLTNYPLLYYTRRCRCASFDPQAAKNTVYIGLAMSMLVFAVMNIAQVSQPLLLPVKSNHSNAPCTKCTEKPPQILRTYPSQPIIHHFMSRFHVSIQAMPYLDKPFNVSKESFDAIFGSAKLMYIASVSAYLVRHPILSLG